VIAAQRLSMVALLSTLGTVTPVQVQQRNLVTDDGVRLHYRQIGSGPDVVVIPVATWTSPHFDSLAREGRRVIYYDPRGRGRSETGDLKAVSLERATRDLEQLREQLAIDRMALIGWSGYGLEMAAYALAHPNHVTRLVQLNPVPPRQEPYMSRRAADIRGRIDRAAWQKYQELIEAKAEPTELCRPFNRAMAPAFFAHPERAFDTIDQSCDWPAEWPTNQEQFFSALMPSIANLDLRSRIGELRMPRLVIHGDRDLIALEGVKEWLVPASSDARLLIVKGADHGSFLDEPEAVLGAVDGFLSNRWPAGSTSGS
jgi:proline iminopeptidase